jgi:hypothetical protein
VHTAHLDVGLCWAVLGWAGGILGGSWEGQVGCAMGLMGMRESAVSENRARNCPVSTIAWGEISFYPPMSPRQLAEIVKPDMMQDECVPGGWIQEGTWVCARHTAAR